MRANFQKYDLYSAPIARALPRYIVPFLKFSKTGKCFKTMLFPVSCVSQKPLAFQKHSLLLIQPKTHVTAKICSHRRVRVEISTRTRWFFLCWKFVIFHAKFMCGVSTYPTQPLFALPVHHWVPLQTLPTVGRLLPLQSVPKTILNFPKPCFQIVL